MTRPYEREEWTRDDDNYNERERDVRRLRSGRDDDRDRYRLSESSNERYRESPEYRSSNERGYYAQRQGQERYGRERYPQENQGLFDSDRYGHERYGQDRGQPRAWQQGDRGANYGSGWYGQNSSVNALRGGFAGRGPRDYTRSDDRIREDVCDRLSANDEVDAGDITVRVQQGEVTLEGTTPDRHQKRLAEDISENVQGVKDVHNQLKANKGLMQEVGDKLMGRDTDTHGHAGSGTRNSPSTSSTVFANGRT